MSRVAAFILAVKPNSLACFTWLIVSAPALASPSTFAPLACAWTSKEEKSVVSGNGYSTEPSTLPPAPWIIAVVSLWSWWPNA